MTRTDIINKLIEKNNYISYVEIGTQNPNANFNKINAKVKTSIDPASIKGIDFQGTSDQFFESLTDEKFDIIFIDGLHHSDQVDKDIKNSLKHLNSNGSIVCHDCLPTTEDMQKVPRITSEWTGDVWKSIAKLRVNRSDLYIYVVDTDYGCGVITKGFQKLYTPTEEYLNYQYYSKNKIEMLNVISVKQFDKL